MACGLSTTRTPPARSQSQLLYENKLETWGWIMLIWGILVLISGFLVFGGSQFGRWIGILAASIAMVVNMTWIFAFPIAALVEVLLAALVLYALVVYGGRDRATGVPRHHGLERQRRNGQLADRRRAGWSVVEIRQCL